MGEWLRWRTSRLVSFSLPNIRIFPSHSCAMTLAIGVEVTYQPGLWDNRIDAVEVPDDFFKAREFNSRLACGHFGLDERERGEEERGSGIYRHRLFSSPEMP
jgi:hypothetical protein